MPYNMTMVATSLPLEDRFWALVDRSDLNGCWPWLGARNTQGYGNFRVGNQVVKAHRVAFELLYETQLDDDTQLHHECKVRHCVNPEHMLWLTRAQHMLLEHGFVGGKVLSIHGDHWTIQVYRDGDRKKGSVCRTFYGSHAEAMERFRELRAEFGGPEVTLPPWVQAIVDRQAS